MTEARSLKSARFAEPLDQPIRWEPSIAFLRSSIAFILAGTVVFELVLLGESPVEVVRVLLNMVLLLVAAASWFLLARRRLRYAVWTLGAGVWGYITIASVLLGGVNSDIIILYPVTILLAGWLGGARVGMSFALLSAAATLGFVVGERLGYLPAPFKTSPEMRWIIQVCVFVFSAILIANIVRSYGNRLKEARKLSSDLASRTAALEMIEEDLRSAQAIANVGSWTYDIPNDSLRLSAEACRILGLPEDVSLSQSDVLSRIHADDLGAVARAWQAALEGGKPFDSEHRVAVGATIRWVRQKSRLERDASGTPLRAVGTTQDITNRKNAEEEIRNLAFYDVLTRLPNRRFLLDRLKQALASAARSESRGALLFIDLDHFKTLNDTQGHDIGDQLLQQVARRLTDCVREGDTVARFGGDEFVVMLEDLDKNARDAAAHARLVGEKILLSLNQQYPLAGHQYSSSASIGIALFGGSEVSSDDLLRQTDLAMYQAKEAGRDTLRFFDQEMEAAVTSRVALEKDLRRAISDNQFIVYYQAQVDGDGSVTAAEALLRWRRPQRGIVAPAEFIPLAEDTGLILPLGQWVLQTACTQLALWASVPRMAHLQLAVNVSAHQFRQSDFVDQVVATLEATGADPSHLKLELTESLLFDDAEDVIIKMGALKLKGVGFSLDDFGTGYSSLAYLKRLPLSQLKIDQSFVRDILTDANDAAIAKMIVVLAETLGLKVIAEGVESAGQKDYLERIGCHAHQGYLFSYPLPLEQFEEFAQRV